MKLFALTENVMGSWLGVLIMSMSTSLDMELTGGGHKDKKFIHPFFLVSLMRYICIVLSACFLKYFHVIIPTYSCNIVLTG